MQQKRYRHAFLAFGIILFIIGIDIVKTTYSMKTIHETYALVGAKKVDAVCTKVEPIKNNSMNVVSGYNVFITYEYNGETYENVPLEHYEISILKGDTVTVLVNETLPIMVTIDYPGPYYKYYVVLQYVIMIIAVGFIGAHIYMVRFRKT